MAGRKPGHATKFKEYIMYYLEQVIKQFEAPALKLIKLEFTGPDEMLTIWEDSQTRDQYALWERDYMVGYRVEQGEIEDLAGLRVAEPIRVKREFWQEGIDERYRDETDFYRTSLARHPGLKYLLFRLPETPRQTSEATPPTQLSESAYRQILAKFNIIDPLAEASRYEFKGVEYQDEDYLLTRWHLQGYGQDYLLWQGWFLLAPSQERDAIQVLAQKQPGLAVAVKKYGRYPHRSVEQYTSYARASSPKAHQQFLLFEAK